MKRSFFLQVLQHLIQIFPSEAFPIPEGKLKSRALNMAEQDEEVIRIDQSVLRGLTEEIIRVFDDELIQGLASCDKNRQRLF